MPAPGRPSLTPAQNRLVGNAEQVLEICRKDLGLSDNDACQVLHVALALARGELDAQRNNRGSEHRTYSAANQKRAE